MANQIILCYLLNERLIGKDSLAFFFVHSFSRRLQHMPRLNEAHVTWPGTVAA